MTLDPEMARKLASSPIPAGVEPVDVPLPTPPGWRLVDRTTDGKCWRIPGGKIVIASGSRHDGLVWLHMSMSHKARLPTWPELVAMRDALVGPNVEAYQVCPPADRYVNLHARVLHLWACMDRPSGFLPRFDGEIGGITTI